MKKIIFSLGFVFLSFGVNAQWAVYDKKVHDEIIKVHNEVKKINKINALTNQEIVKLDSSFKNESSTQDSQSNTSQNSTDIKIGSGDNLVTLRGLDSKFHEIDEDELKKYIDTKAECGDEKNTSHHNACMGLRNIRLQTIKQSQSMLRNIDARRKQIVKLIEASRQLNGDDVASGVMQRYHFELQALQSLMQADTMQLQVLMDGYKYREAVYQTQMNEARSKSDTNSRGTFKMPFIKF